VVVLDAQPGSPIVTVRVVRNRSGPLGEAHVYLREHAPVGVDTATVGSIDPVPRSAALG